MTTKKWMFAATTCAAIVAVAPPAAALDAKRTVIVCGGASDPVALRARAELERASIGVLSPPAAGDVSRTEIETLTRASGASAALIIRQDGVDVWVVDDTTHRALLIERVEDNDLGALRGVEIVRASFAPPGAATAAAAAPASAPATPERVTAKEQRTANATDEVPRWTIGASTGPAVLLSQNKAYANSFVVPLEAGLQRALGRTVSLGIYGAGAPGVSVLNGQSRHVAQWRVGAALQLRLSAKPEGAWTSFATGYTVLELTNARRGVDAALSAGYDFRAGDRTTIGPFVSVRGGVSEGPVLDSGPFGTIDGPATLFASGVAGARVAFDGL
jgi:hypothetical protein